jgi:DNA-binding transcriptional LysR family regulator
MRLVQYFVAVAEELHFGRAATRLHIAQPSLSQEIRRLEQQLGVTLLERTSRRVELTPAGEALLTDGRRLLAQAQRVIQNVRAAGSEQVTVAFYGSAASTLLPTVLQTFREEHPAVEVSVRELLLDEINEVLDGTVDLAFTRLLPGQAGPDIEIEVLGREPRQLAVAATHPFAARDSLVYADLRNESFITNPVVDSPPVRWLAEQQRHGLPGRVAAEAASIQEILALVASARGVCLVPESVAEHYPRADVTYVRVLDADPAVVSLAWTNESARTEVEAFIEVARRIAALGAVGALAEHESGR